ncbi:MAG: signal peptidase I [Candidatus Methylomirabilales bacterium]
MARSDGVKRKRAFFDWHLVWTEKRRANRLAFILFWSILMAYFCKVYVVSVGIVHDISMQKTLPEGGYYLVNKYIYHFVPPERGDIIVLREDGHGSEEYVKRVIGLPGETLAIRFGHVYINGRRLVEPYAVGPTYPDLGPYRIQKDTFFVLGDNRAVSQDSRFFGAVARRNIDGKVKPGELFPFW